MLRGVPDPDEKLPMPADGTQTIISALRLILAFSRAADIFQNPQGTERLACSEWTLVSSGEETGRPSRTSLIFSFDPSGLKQYQKRKCWPNAEAVLPAVLQSTPGMWLRRPVLPATAPTPARCKGANTARPCPAAYRRSGDELQQRNPPGPDGAACTLAV